MQYRIVSSTENINSEEVLRKTYVHFEENTLASVMAMIAEIE